MATDQAPVLTYIASQFRVRVEICRAHTKQAEFFPEDILSRAKTKLEQIQSTGKISQYVINDKLANDVWAHLRANSSLPDSYKVSFTLASGSPELVGLQIEKGPNDKAAILVTLLPGSNSKGWLKEWIKTSIFVKAKEFSITESLASAQIQSCCNRLASGESVSNFPLPLVSSYNLNELNGKMFGVLASKARREITVIVNDIKGAADPRQLRHMQSSVVQAMDKLKQAGVLNLQFHRQDLVNCIQGAQTGPESIGIGCPLFVLAASGGLHEPVEAVRSATHSKVTDRGTPPPVKDNTPRFFSISVSADKMKAIINNFDPELYKKTNEKLDRPWFEAQLKHFGVIYGLADDIWSRIEEALLGQKNLDGMIAAEGQAPIPGSDPYLHFIYKDAPTQVNEADVIDIREAQQRSIVKTGQCIAEVRFKKAPIIGRTVLGKALYGPTPDLSLNLGDGVVQRETGRYFATMDGLPVWNEPTLSITKILIHKGDVDLKSGNIRFDGPVEIHGSIDSGSTVDVTGPLMVHGMIRAGFVYSKTTIHVRQGICTTEKGIVKCKGDIQADFIENSHVIAGGNVRVNKAILNSRVYAMRSILAMGPDSIIGGGKLSSRDALLATNLGFPSGAKTYLNIGTDILALRRVTLRQQRIECLKATSERYRLELREITSKREAQLTARHKARKEKLMQLLNKVRLVSEKATKLYEDSKANLNYNANAIIAVSNKLSTNINIELASLNIPVTAENLGVGITTKKRKDGHLCAIEEIKAEIDRLLASYQQSPTSTQKAS